MYYTQHKIDAIFSRRNKNFYLIQLAAINPNIDLSEISNHTARDWAERYGKILSPEEFSDLFNSGLIDKAKYYIRVF